MPLTREFSRRAGRIQCIRNDAGKEWSIDVSAVPLSCFLDEINRVLGQVVETGVILLSTFAEH
jgi:hypothetical protein